MKSDRCVRVLIRLLIISMGLLIAATWRLWIKKGDFPQVPVWSGFNVMTDVLGGVCVMFGASILVHRPNSRWRRPAATVLLLGLALAVGRDVHRLQPWIWQLMLLCGLIGLVDNRALLPHWRWLVISMYAYSALWKLDAVFLQDFAPALIEPFWNRMGSVVGAADIPVPLVLPWLFPVVEFSIAVGLALPGTRRWAAVDSGVMHLGLLLLLGPLGAGHSPGVLLWNVYFVAQNYWLFWKPIDHSLPATSEVASETCLHGDSLRRFRDSPMGYRLATVLMVGVSFGPLGYVWGLCDAWIAWAVYSPALKQVIVWIPEKELDKLPESARGAISAPHWEDVNASGLWALDYRILEPNRWSLRSLNVPSYPAPWFREAIAKSLAEKHQISDLRVSRSHWRYPWMQRYQW